MAQLIKLCDYISRYEADIFHYPGRFIRLKNENWKKMNEAWELQKQQNDSRFSGEEQKGSSFSKWKSLFQKREEESFEEENTAESNSMPQTKEGLKQYFLDNLLPFQLKWASTTVSKISFLDRYYYEDFTLKYFLQRIPDTHLIMYLPVFQLKNSPMEGDIIMISPIGIEIIRLIEMDSDYVIKAGDDRTWYKEKDAIQSRLLSPLVSLKRTEKVVRSILNKYEIDFPIKKVILSRTNTIDFDLEPFRTRYIDKANHENWLLEKRNSATPLKHNQLKVADSLLKYCYTNAKKRPEWEEPMHEGSENSDE